jgi:hypothetical protein
VVGALSLAAAGKDVKSQEGDDDDGRRNRNMATVEAVEAAMATRLFWARLY